MRFAKISSFHFPTLAADERESLRMILDSVRAYAAERVDSAKFDHDGAFPDGVRQGLHELGVMGLSIPEEYGGFGASAKVYNRVFGEIGGTDPALCVYFGAHQSIGCKGIVLFGTEDQKRTLSAALRERRAGRRRSASPSRAPVPTRRR